MKLFISWSGRQSKAIADVCNSWVPAVLQAVKPYFSPTDLEKGTRWSDELAMELDTSRAGLICLTKTNLTAPWLMFEAGALSKSVGNSFVCPILFGVKQSEVTGPLLQFQATAFTKEDVRQFIKTLNKRLDTSGALDATVLDEVFEKWWPDLEERVAKILQQNLDEAKADERSERDLLEEVLGLTRAMNVRMARTGAREIENFDARANLAAVGYFEFCDYNLRTASTPSDLERLKRGLAHFMSTAWEIFPDEVRSLHMPRVDELARSIAKRMAELEG